VLSHITDSYTINGYRLIVILGASYTLNSHYSNIKKCKFMPRDDESDLATTIVNNKEYLVIYALVPDITDLERWIQEKKITRTKWARESENLDESDYGDLKTRFIQCSANLQDINNDGEVVIGLMIPKEQIVLYKDFDTYKEESERQGSDNKKFPLVMEGSFQSDAWVYENTPIGYVCAIDKYKQIQIDEFVKKHDPSWKEKGAKEGRHFHIFPDGQKTQE